MQDIGAFYLYEITFRAAAAQDGIGQLVHSIRAHCNNCRHSFFAIGPPVVSSVGDGGAVIECPECGGRQAVAGAFFKVWVGSPSAAGQSSISPKPNLADADVLP